MLTCEGFLSDETGRRHNRENPYAGLGVFPMDGLHQNDTVCGNA